MLFIKSKNGILDIKSGIIAHQVNCCNAIGAGVSKAIINKYPEVEAAYHEYCSGKSKKELFGTYQMIQITPSLSIVNIFSQMNYGNSTKTGKVYTNMECLTNTLKKLADNHIETVYVPDHIGCGLAGGDWDEFATIMENTDICIVKKQC